MMVESLKCMDKGWSMKDGHGVNVHAMCGERGEGGLGVCDWYQGQCPPCYARGMLWG